MYINVYAGAALLSAHVLGDQMFTNVVDGAYDNENQLGVPP